ncbi:MAG: NACHT domain-containing protein, partial [Chloroflexi bacterium]|nr:NACHT domain-containing protein [Chloroflexota bacterium]
MTNIKIKACTVRVETPTGHPQGTGFILTPTLAVTCAHVVDACGVGLGGCVRLSFQAGGEPIEAEVLANGYHQDADVAFLRLLSPFPSAWLRAGPSAVTPAILGPSANTDGHTFRALGYPVVGDFQGMWAEGKILGSTTDGRGRRVLQLESQNIAPGMSGAPVLDMADNKHPSTGRVVGMVSLTYNADGTLKFRDAAFAVPSEILCDLCPEEIELQQPEKTAGDHIGQVAVKAEGDAVVATHGGTAARYVAVGGDVGGNITVMVQGEDVRAQELAYLDALLKKYDYWLDHYTPLAGIAEVRAAVQDGPRLDLPMPFIPPGFEKLTEHGFGERAEVRREPVDDLRAAVAEHRRIVLLGSPGSGKTTTLWRLAYDYALEAKADAHAPLPLLVPLGGYTGDGPFDVTLARHLGPLAPHLDIYRASGRLILLLDGLNEMPQADYAGRVGRVRDALEQHPDDSVVVTCRALDYVEKMEQLQKVEVSPLDETRIRDFVRNYLGETAGERLFWGMAGGDEVHDLWNTWRRAGETWEAFWTAKEIPEGLGWLPWKARYKLWMSLRKEPPQLLSLGRNPYLLLMMAQVYAGAGGELPANRAKLFAAFVDTLLGREKKRHSQDWIEVECQKEALAALAYAMQDERGRGTTVEHGWAAAHLDQVALDCDVERLLYLASSATLLDASDSTVRFYHQLLQEYFAAREMGRRVAAGEPLERYWPPERWWEPSGWEETVIL